MNSLSNIRTTATRGLTLVELLVAVSVIMLLVAIIYPVFLGAKESAKRVACLSNLKSIGTAVFLYAGDYDDRFPRAITAPYLGDLPTTEEGDDEDLALFPFLDEVLDGYLKDRYCYRCPSDNGAKVFDLDWPMPLEVTPSLFADNGSSYIYRVALASRGVMLSSIENNSSLTIVMDGAGHWHGRTAAISSDEGVDRAEKLRYNALFGDGRARIIDHKRAAAHWFK